MAKFSDSVRWRADAARAWVEEVQRARVRLDRCRDVVREVDSACDGVVCSRADGEGRGAAPVSGDERMVLAVARLEETRGAWADAACEWSEAVDELMRALCRISGTHSQVISLRYVRGMRWDDVASEMHYSADYCREMCTVALAELYEAMPPARRADAPAEV